MERFVKFTKCSSREIFKKTRHSRNFVPAKCPEKKLFREIRENSMKTSPHKIPRYYGNEKFAKICSRKTFKNIAIRENLENKFTRNFSGCHSENKFSRKLVSAKNLTTKM